MPPARARARLRRAPPWPGACCSSCSAPRCPPSSALKEEVRRLLFHLFGRGESPFPTVFGGRGGLPGEHRRSVPRVGTRTGTVPGAAAAGQGSGHPTAQPRQVRLLAAEGLSALCRPRTPPSSGELSFGGRELLRASRGRCRKVGLPVGLPAVRTGKTAALAA